MDSHLTTHKLLNPMLNKQNMHQMQKPNRLLTKQHHQHLLTKNKPLPIIHYRHHPKH